MNPSFLRKYDERLQRLEEQIKRISEAVLGAQQMAQEAMLLVEEMDERLKPVEKPKITRGRG
jgi:archaellum component FlaC